MQVLTKRNLLLGNVVLVLAFLAVVYAACRPLLSPSPLITPGDDEIVQVAGPETLKAQIKHHTGMKDNYPLVIRGNNIFAAKVEKPPEVVTPPKLPPLKEPRWELVLIWEPEPGVFEARVLDHEKRPPDNELVLVNGKRFGEYAVEVTEVTEDYVRYEIRDEKHGRVVERFLPPSAAETAGKNWSAIIKKTAARANVYTVDMKRFEEEFKKLAGPEGDWIDALRTSVHVEEYRPGGGTAPLRGYKVIGFEPESPLDDLGVELQDVIVAVGKRNAPMQPVTGEAQGLALLREALEWDEVRLQLDRLGIATYITIELRRF
jgi:hypothetical protein